LTCDALFKDFCVALTKNSLLRQAENASMRVMKSGVILYAVAAMHQTEVTLDDTSHANLCANRCDGGKISVWASAQSHWNPDVDVAFSMFTTELAAHDWCDASLLLSPNEFWSDAIEVTAQQRLAAML
jgi:hypothetical protein